jgi:3',5'-cyclic AMP phosphodiesterase CpdA
LLIMGCRHIAVFENEVEGSLRDKYDHTFNWVQAYDEVRVPEIAVRPGARWVLGIGPDGEAVGGQLESHETVLSFIHLSDVQLRDERIRLNGRKISRILDSFAQVTEFAKEQQQYDSAVYLALVKTMNQYAELFEKETDPEARRQFPLFLAHTGDAIHAGVLQELYEFLWISQKFELPWLQMIGNHDITAFGTKLFKVQLHNPRLGFFPLYDNKLFMHLHGTNNTPSRKLFAPGIFIAPAQSSSHEKTADMLGKENHGFDLEVEAGKEVVGYYGLTPPGVGFDEIDPEDGARWWEERLLKDFKVRFLFLDTTDSGKLHRGGVGGTQLAWLKDELKLAEQNGEHVVVFGHHDLRSGFVAGGDELVRMFAHQQGFLGYFCGHTHKQEMRIIEFEGDDGSDSSYFWQIIAPPVVEWPQAGLFVRLVQLADGALAWDLTPFTHGYQRRPGETDKELDPDLADAAQRLRAQVIRASEAAKADYSRGDPDEEIRQPPIRLLLPPGAVR